MRFLLALRKSNAIPQWQIGCGSWEECRAENNCKKDTIKLKKDACGMILSQLMNE